VLTRVYEVYAPGLAATLATGFVVRDGEGARRFDGRLGPFDLDDLVQDAFIRAFDDRARRAYDGLRPFAPFLLAIARNSLVDRARRERRYAARLATVRDEVADAPAAPGPDVAADERAIADAYLGFRAGLDELARQVWSLRFEEGASRRVVEEQTRLTPMQVRSREKQLRARFVEWMAQHGLELGVVLALTGLLRRGWTP